VVIVVAERKSGGCTGLDDIDDSNADEVADKLTCFTED
jgi:hypothetical protein